MVEEQAQLDDALATLEDSELLRISRSVRDYNEKVNAEMFRRMRERGTGSISSGPHRAVLREQYPHTVLRDNYITVSREANL